MHTGLWERQERAWLLTMQHIQSCDAGEDGVLRELGTHGQGLPVLGEAQSRRKLSSQMGAKLP